jgi:TolB-like protein/DNA-binding winged helix-turn-helix (wHTH) protein
MTPPVAAIDLSHEADFTLGGAVVKPSLRVFALNGAEEIIEPRVMQVLVALARRCGEVVSRDDLVTMCWGGRVVGDDAISRPIAMLRKLGETSGAFAIETVPRVGYRLTAKGEGVRQIGAAAGTSDHTASVAPSQASAAKASTARRHWPVFAVAAGALVAVMIAALLVLVPRFAAMSASASVAVLPFTDENVDEAHLATGLTAEMVSRLRNVTGLTVAGGDWMPALAKQVTDPKALGERLAVDHLLNGSIQRAGDRLRISVLLTTAANGHVVWAKTYDDVAPDDIFALQDQIAVKVANELSVALDVGQQSTQYGGTKNFEAYDHYLRGRFLRNAPNTAGPVGELETAVAIDPNYARAWAELVNAYGGVARIAPTQDQWEAAMQKMDVASKRAEALAPKSWTGHTGRAWYFVGRNNWIEADAAMDRAIALGETPDPDFHGAIVAFYGQSGRASSAWIRTQKVIALDPNGVDTFVNRLIHGMQVGDFPGLWAAYDEAHRLSQDYNYQLEYYSLWAALADGKLDRAHAILKILSEKTSPAFASIDSVLDSKPALLVGAKATLDNPAALRGPLSNAALMAGYAGDTDLAVKLLRRAYLGPGWAGNFMIWFPELHETRKTEGFKQFVRDVGFVDMWRKSGNWGDFCKPTTGDDFECE